MQRHARHARLAGSGGGNRLARSLAENVDSFGNNAPVVGNCCNTFSSALLMVNCASEPVFFRK